MRGSLAGGGGGKGVRQAAEPSRPAQGWSQVAHLSDTGRGPGPWTAGGGWGEGRGSLWHWSLLSHYSWEHMGAYKDPALAPPHRVTRAAVSRTSWPLQWPGCEVGVGPWGCFAAEAPSLSPGSRTGWGMDVNPTQS